MNVLDESRKYSGRFRVADRPACNTHGSVPYIWHVRVVVARRVCLDRRVKIKYS